MWREIVVDDGRGIGNVLAASLGAPVSVIGVVGTDRAGTTLLEELERVGIDREGVLIDRSRPTTCKCRLMLVEHSQQVFRFDEESTDEISATTEECLLSSLRERVPKARAIICSDYLKGVLTKQVLRQAAGLANMQGIPLITAPKEIRPENTLAPRF